MDIPFKKFENFEDLKNFKNLGNLKNYKNLGNIGNPNQNLIAENMKSKYNLEAFVPDVGRISINYFKDPILYSRLFVKYYKDRAKLSNKKERGFQKAKCINFKNNERLNNTLALKRKIENEIQYKNMLKIIKQKSRLRLKSMDIIQKNYYYNYSKMAENSFTQNHQASSDSRFQNLHYLQNSHNLHNYQNDQGFKNIKNLTNFTNFRARIRKKTGRNNFIIFNENKNHRKNLSFVDKTNNMNNIYNTRQNTFKDLPAYKSVNKIDNIQPSLSKAKIIKFEKNDGNKNNFKRNSINDASKIDEILNKLSDTYDWSKNNISL